MEPFDHLPHRQPFVMLDNAEVIEEGRHAKGIKLITVNDPAVLPGGIMPDIYIIEAMAQISGIAGGRKESSRFAAIKNLNFSRTAYAGDTLELESIFEKKFSGLCMFRCRASVSGDTVAEGGIILYFDETA
ncbi:MAG: 3-hydroxyacyl-ACP dehydratase FabZ family protein [Nitrospirota bacterium]